MTKHEIQALISKAFIIGYRQGHATASNQHIVSNNLNNLLERAIRTSDHPEKEDFEKSGFLLSQEGFVKGVFKKEIK